MTVPRLISVIIPSFNDPRIVRAIRSVRYFDDADCVRIVVVDGGSRPELRNAIAGLLTADDTFVCEPDEGIFDALNKGLARCTTEFVGWLGSDDLYTGRLRATRVLASLENHDLLVANLAHFRDDRITRLTHALPARLHLAKYGLNNPHFATFGRRSVLACHRFSVGMLGSDIEYFIAVFETKPRVTTIPEVAVLAEEGGFSTESPRRILASNAALLNVYARRTGRIFAPLCLTLKLGYKAWSAAYYRLVHTHVRTFCVPDVFG